MRFIRSRSWLIVAVICIMSACAIISIPDRISTVQSMMDEIANTVIILAVAKKITRDEAKSIMIGLEMAATNLDEAEEMQTTNYRLAIVKIANVESTLETIKAYLKQRKASLT